MARGRYSRLSRLHFPVAQLLLFAVSIRYPFDGRFTTVYLPPASFLHLAIVQRLRLLCYRFRPLLSMPPRHTMTDSANKVFVLTDSHYYRGRQSSGTNLPKSMPNSVNQKSAGAGLAASAIFRTQNFSQKPETYLKVVRPPLKSNKTRIRFALARIFLAITLYLRSHVSVQRLQHGPSYLYTSPMEAYLTYML